MKIQAQTSTKSQDTLLLLLIQEIAKITVSWSFERSSPNSVSLVLLFYILFPESLDDISNNNDVDGSNSHDGRSQHGGWRNKVKRIFHHLLGSKVDEEREKEDHETVKEKTKQGRVSRLFFGTCLKIPSGGRFS